MLATKSLNKTNKNMKTKNNLCPPASVVSCRFNLQTSRRSLQPALLLQGLGEKLSTPQNSRVRAAEKVMLQGVEGKSNLDMIEIKPDGFESTDVPIHKYQH